MKNKRDKNEVHDMVEDELLELSKVMDVSKSMRKFDELKHPLPILQLIDKKGKEIIQLVR